MSALIRVTSLKAGFRGVEVLKGIGLTVRRKEVLAVIGSSNAGKSTFLRCLNRMHERDRGAWVSGTVALEDTDIYGHQVDPVLLRRSVGMVFPKPVPFPGRSIRENVLAGLRLTGRHVVAEADGVVEHALRQVALWGEVRDLLGQPTTRLSVGQLQRLCIARALAVRPQILLMDAPCSVLDPIETAQVEDLISGLASSTTIVLATRSLQQAARISDRTAFFSEGELIESGPTGRLFTSPVDLRTENYLTGRAG